MKKILVFFLLFLVSQVAISQNENWESYEIDSIISLEFPNEISLKDTIAKGLPLKIFVSQNNDDLFIVQKILYGEENIVTNYSELPLDLEDLNKSYKEFTKSYAKEMPYSIKDQGEIKQNDFHGYYIIQTDSERIVNYTKFILLNKNMYSISYFNKNGINEAVKEIFFSSLIISSNIEISQFEGRSLSYRTGHLIGSNLPLIIIISIFLYFIYRKIKKN